MNQELEQNEQNVEQNTEQVPVIDAETQARIDEVNKIIEAESIEPTVAINILINAVQVSFDKEHFNDLDRYLISKALTCLKEKVDSGEDFLVKVK